MYIAITHLIGFKWSEIGSIRIISNTKIKKHINIVFYQK